MASILSRPQWVNVWQVEAHWIFAMNDEYYLYCWYIWYKYPTGKWNDDRRTPHNHYIDVIMTTVAHFHSCLFSSLRPSEHICVGNLTIIGSANALSPSRRQAIIWTKAGILLIGPMGTNLSEIWSEIHTFSLKKMYLKMSSGKWHPFCLGLNVLKGRRPYQCYGYVWIHGIP